MPFFKNLQSNSLPMGKSFQSNATKFPHPRLHIAVNPKEEPKKGAIKISPNKTLQSFINVAASLPCEQWFLQAGRYGRETPRNSLLSQRSYMFLLQLQLYVLTIIHVTLRRIHKPLGESPHFVSLNILFLVKGTKNVSFISLQ